MCECSKGYVCPQHIANAKPQTVARRPKGITIREATNTLRGTSISAYNRKPFFTAFRTLQGYLAKKQGRRRCVTRIQVYEYANGTSAPKDVYNTPQEPQNVKECLAEIQHGLDLRAITPETADVFRRYVQTAAIVPMTMQQFMDRYVANPQKIVRPLYWTNWLENKMLNKGL